MTNLTGKMFFSYRRNQDDVAEFLVESLHEYGIRTWQDISDLKPEPTQDEIRTVLEVENSELAGGIVLVSDDVFDSEFILEVELPHLHNRWKNEQQFFVVVALCPGVEYDDASEILSESPTVLDFSNWNKIKLGSKADTPVAADDVATAVLTERIRLNHKQLDADQPLGCSLNTYGSSSYATQPVVTIDWSSHFKDGLPAPRLWNQRLIPRLHRVIDILEGAAPGRSVHVHGQAHLPAAFALGRCLRTTRGIDATWLQQSNGKQEPWSLHIDEQESGFDGDLHVNDIAGSDLAVLVSGTNEVNAVVGRSKQTLPDFAGVLELSLGDDIGSLLSAPEAVHAARLFQREVQSALNELSATSTIHLFMAAPAGLVFLYGQQSNTFPSIQTYLLETTDGERTYRPAALLK
ncbi:SAVED domain-containing protein [Halocatena marina]|uniref:SAVED domain-containing protein n=1 Tax=Halocatena marina TaxID=2934937 RepID=A0ABD5YYG2_9EURY|nr:SAVED domain-containing protein [Halocatena marina]